MCIRDSFNGGVEEPFLNETRVLIPSPNVATYDLQPQMSAPKVGEAVKLAMKNQTDFIVVNLSLIHISEPTRPY